MVSRAKTIGRRLALAFGVLLLVLAIGWSTTSGRVRIADVYWNILLELSLVEPHDYVGPHFWAASFAPDGRTLAAGGMSRDVLLYDLTNGQRLPSPYRHDTWVMEVLWSADGRWFASTSFSGNVVVQEAASGTVVYRNQVGGGEVAYTVAFHPTEPLLAWGAYDGKVRLVDLAQGTEIRSFQANKGGVLYVTWTPDGGQLVSTGEDGTIRFWDPENGSPGQVLTGHEAGITTVSFTSDGRRMVSGGDDATVRVWDVSTGKALRVESPHAGWINFSTVLPDDRHFISVGTDNRIFIWPLEGDGDPRILDSHTDWIMCARTSWDGTRFVTTGKDGTAKVWDAQTFVLRHTIDMWSPIDRGGFRWPAL